MKRFLTFLAACAPALGAAADAPRTQTVRVVHFSDYHSHAPSFHSEGRADQGGIARAIAYLRRVRAEGEALVLSGGDMLNRRVPAWSDVYGCVEWPWMDGLVDAMALGNHDLDYGYEAFANCRKSTRVPVLAANLVDTDGRPYLAVDGKPYLVREVAGVRIGAFALAGRDVQQLIRPRDRPLHTEWRHALETARAVVRTLREQEKVQAVVFFGHQSRQDDEAMARAVPGIDLVLGTHSHHKSGLVTIPGTQTRYIAAYQYLTYLADVRLSFQEGRLVAVEGALVPVDGSIPPDPQVASLVADLQLKLRARRPERFAVVGRTALELSDEGVSERESLIGNWATDELRRRAGTHVFFSTASSFRGALPPGNVTMEDFLSAIPYTNRTARVRLRGSQLLDWLTLSVQRRGSDLFSQLSGARYVVRDGRPAEVEVLKDPAAPEKGYAPLDPASDYWVGTTDYQAGTVDGYRDIFRAGNQGVFGTTDVHQTLLDALRHGPVSAALDGRTR
jgi:5'-nucleotidase / UDP-sugar diphosphatase